MNSRESTACSIKPIDFDLRKLSSLVMPGFEHPTVVLNGKLSLAEKIVRVSPDKLP